MRMTFFLLLFLSAVQISEAQIDARLFRYPDVSQTHITFAYGGDIWIVAKTGGNATKLSSPKGSETFPKFSPDGKSIAFCGNYDGNTDIYTLSVGGGIPTRITHHGMYDRVIDWYPDGQSLLYASSMESGKQRFSQFYKVSAQGGLPEKLPVAYGEFATLSPDGNNIAFTQRSRISRTWKRYRGGMAADIWTFNLATNESVNITDNLANDELPMWMGNTIYYLSDKGPEQRFNIWAYHLADQSEEQLTEFENYDVHFPSHGNEEIVFEAGGELYLLDVNSKELTKVEIQISSDLITVKPRKESVSDNIQNFTLSPDGNRAIFEARGELFSLPAEKGFVKNLTHSSGTAERHPAWSPNGKYVAYWSDKSGEYELTLKDLTQKDDEKKLTSLGSGFRYQLFWSPNSKKLAFIDQTMTISIYDMESEEVTKVDKDIYLFEGGLRSWRASWSPDSRWLAYPKTLTNRNYAIFIYNTASAESTQATSGFYSDFQPAFGPKGDHLFLMTNRTFDPIYSDYDNTWIYPNATSLAVIPLRKEVASPLLPENDTVAVVLEEESSEDEEESKEDEEKEEIVVNIDFENFENRLVMLPPDAGNMNGLHAVEGKVIYVRYPNSGASSGSENALTYFDLEEKEEKTIMKGISGFDVTKDGSKLLVRQKNQYGIVEVSPDQSLEKTMPVQSMEMTIDPKQEWAQIFNDAWRFERDYFYDIDMHGVDWNAIKEQYAKLIPYATNRNDINFILGEMIGELNASHTYRGGGDTESPDYKQVGYLGVNWEEQDNQFKVKEIIRGAPWDHEVRSPLDEPGINVKEGDYILAVNGIALTEYTDPWAAFEGLANKTVELTYNDQASFEGAKTAVVKTLSDETRLRNLAWIETKRKRVDEASNGNIGYIYVPSTGIDGQRELVRQFYGQWNKEGLIVDERFNNGGQIPDRFIELLNRKPLAFWDVRDGQNWQWPPVAHFGSMAMLINGWSGSGGDAFPDYFKKAELGPLIGTRTWGGLIGLSGSPSLIDGGVVTVPTFRMYNPDGSWFKEGYGVEPDIKVIEDPTELAKGIDGQLEKAIEEVMKSVEQQGPLFPEVPSKEDRTQAMNPRE